MSYADPPWLHNYYSDWTQLGFFYKKFKGPGYAAYHFHEMDAYGIHELHIMMMNLWVLKTMFEQKGFKQMIKLFIILWTHEYLHLIGLTEKAVVMPKPTVILAS